MIKHNFWYCKRGYFPWGKISRKCRQDISRGGNFHDTSPFFLHKGIWVLFSREGNFCEEAQKNRQKRKNYPRTKISTFTVSSCMKICERFDFFFWQVAELVRELRMELDQLLTDKIKNPHMDLCTCPKGSKIIDTIVRLITTQWNL